MLEPLNTQQRQAVLESINKNVVLLAGAGSGKTKTMVSRAQYLMEEENVDPSNIMMVTFTNKAAKEILNRMMKVNPNAKNMWIGTFHSICVRIMHMQGECLNVNNFTIMDTRDCKELVKEILDDIGIDSTPYMISDIVSKISYYKNNLKRPADVIEDPDEKRLYGTVYQEYQNRAWKRKTFDFDDLLIYTILLINSFPKVKEWVNNKFKYLMVDECQDTNSAQFVLIKLISGNNNVMLVGDSNQSIYAFRNAKPEYLEGFAMTTPNTSIVRLEQNYRSTQTIINAANAVIAHNTFGSKINMFSTGEVGEKIKTIQHRDPYFEARWLAAEILSRRDKNMGDFAVIYRANYQSRVLEEEFNKAGIPYTIFGAQSFYGRKEVKDLLAWLRLYVNHNDVNSFKRIAMTFPGIGEKTVQKAIQYVEQNGTSFTDKETIMSLGPKAGSTLMPINMITSMTCDNCLQVVSNVITFTSYRSNLVSNGTQEANEKLSIIDEFCSMLKAVAEEDKMSMMETIDQISLLSDAKGEEKSNANAVKFMTAHASKGLEFNTVFIIGAEEGTFPHLNSMGNAEDIEEERRLFYVAMTRAMKELYVSCSTHRKFNGDGNLQFCNKSRFLLEIPRIYTEETF